MSTWNEYYFFYRSVFWVLNLVKEMCLVYRCSYLDFVKKLSLTLRGILCTLNSWDISSKFPITAMYLIMDLPDNRNVIQNLWIWKDSPLCCIQNHQFRLFSTYCYKASSHINCTCDLITLFDFPKHIALITAYFEDRYLTKLYIPEASVTSELTLWRLTTTIVVVPHR